MPYRKSSFIVGEYYHVYNRGSDKRIIFHDSQDYSYFQNLLHLMNTPTRKQTRDYKLYTTDSREKLVSIGAYCCMPNHFHILIKQEQNNGVSLFLKKVLTSYAMFYNKKYKRTGTLFEGRFKAKCIDRDVYLKYLFAYIHLNPLKMIDEFWESKNKYPKEYLQKLKTFLFSSFLDYVGVIRKEGSILNRKAFPEYFPGKESFSKEILNWIKLKVE